MLQRIVYKPGSFSKNFAWHGTGLRKLHTVIRDGFQNRLVSVERQRFRDCSGLDASLSLIPVNFFLHNRDGQMSVDELVFRAIEHPHSTRFDRLGLFALHLSRAGSGTGVVERPAMWANEFVHERLWSGGTWHSSALSNASLDPFIEDRMDAQDNVRMKCRNNYRHLFELCRFWPSSLPLINSGAEQWIAPALFLAWDRHILGGGLADKASLIDLVNSDKLYKLLGIGQMSTIAHAGDLADLYISVGHLARFFKAKKAPASAPVVTSEPATEVSEERGLEWLEQQEEDEVVARRLVERREQRRARNKVAALKRHYNNACIFCGTRLQVGEDSFYSEVAHIKGLGEPHNGPDKASNMLVLCPNHHLQFDRGVLRLHKVGAEYRISSKVAQDALHGRKVILTHNVADDYIKYHHDWFA